jgi:dipeptidyl aminopeptidase/acylaminoacyl peptidase
MLTCRRWLVFALAVPVLAAAIKYQKPPKEVEDVLNAPATPAIEVSPAHTYVLLAEPLRYPPISELAQPMLRLAGIRINPKNNGLHRNFSFKNLTLERVSDGRKTLIVLPKDAKISAPRWSPDGSMFAFTNIADTRIELWVGGTATGRVHRIATVRLNAVLGNPFGFGRGPRAPNGGPFVWVDSRTMLVRLVPANRGPAPVEPLVPLGPHVQESDGHAGPVPTFEDMLSNPHDEDLFDYYAKTQLAWLDVRTGRLTPIGKPGLYEAATVSPDGKHLLIEKIHRPYSYLHPYRAFPKDVEVWDRAGNVEHVLAKLPLEDNVPLAGVPMGPREYVWRPSAPATLIWVEALDRGNPHVRVPYRDRVMALSAPFTAAPTEIFRTAERFAGIEMAAKGPLALISDSSRHTRMLRTYEVDLDNPSASAALIWNRNQQDRYHDPGRPILSPGRDGGMLMYGDDIYLTGNGSTPEGDRPFLDRYNLKTHESQQIFRCDDASYETVEGLLDDQGTRFVTRHESPTDPPNYFVHTAGSAEARALTKFPDPTPLLRGIEKRLVTYKRADGVPLSFMLYLPPGYHAGTRLPTVIWAYPFEYNNAATAGEVSGSSKRFTTITGMSELFYVLEGYAVLENAAMPVIGPPETVNDTYVQQIVADAKAAIDKAAEIGVTDPNRVGVGGHSYGAFMTANLMAHSDLFKAGVARSGAYNRTLTPFGFQNERRTLWQAPQTYLRMSPFMYADKIKRPILLIHGEDDDNSGTFPIQSLRMYQAIRGNGGTVRYVTLPFEPHGYYGRESIEHTLWEMITWFDKYVKNAGVQATTAAAAN